MVGLVQIQCCSNAEQPAFSLWLSVCGDSVVPTGAVSDRPHGKTRMWLPERGSHRETFPIPPAHPNRRAAHRGLYLNAQHHCDRTLPFLCWLLTACRSKEARGLSVAGMPSPMKRGSRKGSKHMLWLPVRTASHTTGGDNQRVSILTLLEEYFSSNLRSIEKIPTDD